jgi:hypothetical protein
LAVYVLAALFIAQFVYLLLLATWSPLCAAREACYIGRRFQLDNPETLSPLPCDYPVFA